MVTGYSNRKVNKDGDWNKRVKHISEKYPIEEKITSIINLMTGRRYNVMCLSTSCT